MNECINPSQIQEEDLLAYANGEASEAVQEHIRHCTYCRGRTADFQSLDRWLVATLYRTSCPSADDLVRWQTHLLSPDKELLVAAHVRTCHHCTQELAELAATGDDLLSAVFARLGKVQRWLEATLAPAPTVLVHERGTAATQQHYLAGELDIFIGGQTMGTRRRLMGRIYLPPDKQDLLGGLEAWVVQNGQALAKATTDNQGRFVFEDLLPGLYDVGVGWQEDAVLIRNLEV